MHPDLTPYLELGHSDGVTVVTVRDERVLADEKRALYALVEGESSLPTSSQVVLNLENVRMFRSEMLATLINFQRKVKEKGGSVKLCAVEPDILRLLHLTRTDQILDIRKTQREAVDAFRSPGSPGWLSRLFGSR